VPSLFWFWGAVVTSVVVFVSVKVIRVIGVGSRLSKRRGLPAGEMGEVGEGGSELWSQLRVS
jgi:hypothetical protein